MCLLCCVVEDICESDGEEDVEGNELVFDEFFRHDNDFGSDADSDGEPCAAALLTSSATRRNHSVEVIGPIFIHPESEQAMKFMADGSLIECDEKYERDISKLKSMQAVIHPPLPTASSSISIVDAEDGIPIPIALPSADLFDDERVRSLAILIHGRKSGIKHLIEEFLSTNNHIPKAQIRRKILSIASREKSSEGIGCFRWIVGKDTQTSINLEVLFFK